MAKQILYGAGHNLRFHIKDWQARGITPVCVVDASVEKQNTTFSHSGIRLEILPLQEANFRYPDSDYYITLIAPNCYKAKESLILQGVAANRIFILADMFVEYPEEDNSDLPFAPDDMVKSCDYLERGIGFLFDGIYCCCLSSGRSGILIDAETLNAHESVSASDLCEMIKSERKQYFLALNGRNKRPLGDCEECVFLYEKQFSEVTFSGLGGKSGLQLVNDQSTLVCNHRCSYCRDAVLANKQYACQYDNRIVLKALDGFISRQKPSYFFVAINSGETALRKNLDELLDYFRAHELENIYIYSNASVYSKGIERSLKSGCVNLITSIDAGTPETYKKVHGADDFDKVILNLINYSVLGDNRHMRIKYVVLDDESNTSDEDLLGFLCAALLIKPEDINVLPQFRDSSESVPNSTIEFAARMSFLCPIITGRILYFFPALGISGDTEEFSKKVLERVESFDETKKSRLTEMVLNYLRSKLCKK